MKSLFQKSLFPFFLAVVCLFCFSGCSENETLPANQWVSITSASGYLFNSETNTDAVIDITHNGFTTDKISNDTEWDTPSLRYKQIVLDVTKPVKLLGLAFEIKTNAIEGFSVKVEAQLFKNMSVPSNWSELTDEAKSLWERENRIKDKQFCTVWAGKNPDGVSFSFNTEKVPEIDTSYSIKIFFTTDDNSDTEEKNNDYLKNFIIDNFIILVEGD